MKKSKKSQTKLVRTTYKEDVGKLLLDLGKLVFASIFLGGILRGEIPHVILLIGGAVAAIALCTIGLLLIIKEKDGENTPPTMTHNSPVKKE